MDLLVDTDTSVSRLDFGHPRYRALHADLPSRRRVLKLLIGLGAAIGFYALGVLRFAKRADAYEEWGVNSSANACGQTNDPDLLYDGGANQNGYADANGCADGACFGVTHLYEMGRWYAVACAEVGGVNLYQWHFVGDRGGAILGDHANVCQQTFLGEAKDAWRWRINSTCGFCPTTTWRCHDGWKIDTGGTFHDLTIAQGLVYCGETFWSQAGACP